MSTTAGGVTQATVSVSSTSVPVSLIPPGMKFGGWVMRVRTGGTSCLVFAYNGSVPGSPPTDTWELVAGQTLNDSMTTALGAGYAGLGVGWAAVLEVSGSATIDVIYR